MAAMVLHAWPAGVISTIRKPGEWSYEEGVLLDGMAAQWSVSKDPGQLAYIKAAVDKYIGADGSIHVDGAGTAFPVSQHSLDNIELGRATLFLYRVTSDVRYRKAAEFLHAQVAAQPRTASGGFWHKQIYPNQMWLDGAYMAEPFRAQYASIFHQSTEFDDIARQLLLMDQHMRDPASGLMLHGWDESGKMAWADPKTGLSPEVWARAMGWYAMALVDVLDWFPKDHPQRRALLAVLERTMSAVVSAQDQKTGLWWQVMNRERDGDSANPVQGSSAGQRVAGEAPLAGNFPEASASAMFVYALAKGVRLGYLPQEPFDKSAGRGWSGIQRQFVRSEPGGTARLTGTVKAAGLGGQPYRSGTFAYYVAEPTGENDAKGVGAYLLAGSEMQQRR